MIKKSTNYYLLPEEDELHRTCKSQNFARNVMFLVSITRPKFDVESDETFSGKIGVFSFVTKELARRSVVNRDVRTLKTKVINSVNREISKMFLIEKGISTIKEKWSTYDIDHPNFIQKTIQEVALMRMTLNFVMLSNKMDLISE